MKKQLNSRSTPSQTKLRVKIHLIIRPVSHKNKHGETQQHPPPSTSSLRHETPRRMSVRKDQNHTAGTRQCLQIVDAELDEKQNHKACSGRKRRTRSGATKKQGAQNESLTRTYQDGIPRLQGHCTDQQSSPDSLRVRDDEGIDSFLSSSFEDVRRGAIRPLE